MAYFRKRGEKWSYTVNLGIDPITKKRKQVTKSGFPSKTASKEVTAYPKGNYVAFVQAHANFVTDRSRCGIKRNSTTIRAYRYSNNDEHLCAYDRQHGRKGLPTV